MALLFTNTVYISYITQNDTKKIAQSNLNFESFCLIGSAPGK